MAISSSSAIWRTRAAYLKGGLAYALHDVARPGKPRQYDTAVEAQTSALAVRQDEQQFVQTTTQAAAQLQELFEADIKVAPAVPPMVRSPG